MEKRNFENSYENNIDEAKAIAEGEIDVYPGANIVSGNAKIPGWLIFTYTTLPIWGILTLFFFWNGTWGWFDPGYWQQLQKAANTTFPRTNHNHIPP